MPTLRAVFLLQYLFNVDISRISINLPANLICRKLKKSQRSEMFLHIGRPLGSQYGRLSNSLTTAVLLLYLLAVTTETDARREAGVWVDDGNGHSVRAELTPTETAALTKQLVDLLGLPDPPRHHRRHHRYRTQGSAPTYLKSIYDTLDEKGRPNDSNLDPQHRAAVSASDTIITFVNNDPPGGRVHPGGNKRLYFAMANVSLEHALLGAELRLHYRPPPPRPPELHHYAPGPHTLHVYLVTNDISGEIEIARTELTKAGWNSLNVTSAVLTWILYPDVNLGLRLAVTAEGHHHEIPLHRAGISGAHDKDDYRPFLVAFFTLPEESKARSRSRRAAHPLPAPSSPVIRNPYGAFRQVSQSDKLCKLEPLHVSFRDLDWQEWVIAPDGYNANFCDGRCEFPMQAEMNATNHAIVQTLVKVLSAVKDGDVVPPSACCAPKDLATISVLYYDYSNNVILRKYPKMIVKNCACR